MAIQSELHDHLQTGITTVARTWGLTRQDGAKFGFTDHDKDLSFDGFDFRAATGLTATALTQSSGLSVDNAEAIGVLSDASVSEDDIDAGRLDGADVVAWLVNWADVTQRSVLFRGKIGEIRRTGGAFVAELRGLAEQLNLPRGKVFQKPCSAVLGDQACQFDLDGAGYVCLCELDKIQDRRVLRWQNLDGFEPGWFERGRVIVQSGSAAGLSGVIKRDTFALDGTRVIELWEAMRAPLEPGDAVRLEAGCDKRFQTCRFKFTNTLNFQGFPDIPGEDWMASYPVTSGVNSGGSLR